MSDLEYYVLTECLDDWLMVGSLAQAAVVRGYGETTLDVRPIVLETVQRLLAQGYIVLGSILQDGFHTWEGTSLDWLQRLSLVIAVDDEDAWYAAAWIKLSEVGEPVALALESEH